MPSWPTISNTFVRILSKRISAPARTGVGQASRLSLRRPINANGVARDSRCLRGWRGVFDRQDVDANLTGKMPVLRCGGFTDEELDLIINYDIKYRMGQEEE